MQRKNPVSLSHQTLKAYIFPTLQALNEQTHSALEPKSAFAGVMPTSVNLTKQSRSTCRACQKHFYHNTKIGEFNLLLIHIKSYRGIFSAP